MIDKRIFYCWFGKGPLRDLNKDCIATWKKFCPDYEIEEINETNFNVFLTDFSTEAYEKGNWSAVSDTARVEILHNESGFYLDTDIQLFNSLDSLRELDSGFMTEYDIGQPDSAILGRGSKSPFIYETARDKLIQGSVIHKIFVRELYGRYDIHGEAVHTFEDGFSILNEEFFPHRRLHYTNKNTIGVHYYQNTWRNNPIKVLDKSYPFIRVKVYVAGDDKVLYEDKDPISILTVKDKGNAHSFGKFIGVSNYLFNPRVVKLETSKFINERIGWDKTKETLTTSKTRGMTVTYYKDPVVGFIL